MAPENFFSKKAKLGISACLLGQRVRYDGGHKRDYFLTETFGSYVEWVPICPELEVGMGVPRESVRLVGSKHEPKMIADHSGKDWTSQMNSFAAKRAKSLQALELSGYIFKKDSPSCGVERVRVYNSKGMPDRQGRGLYAGAVMRQLPLLPVEEEGRLNDPGLRENFIERVFAYHRWQQLTKEHKSVRALIVFHTSHKFLLLAHSVQHYQRLGRMVAEAKKKPIAEAYENYGRIFMEALAVHANAKKHCNVLEHMVGYFSRQLSAEERKELAELIADFRRQLIPLVVPLTLIRHYVKKYEVAYLQEQVYLEPSPKELMLRNHV
ncbi:MAG: YbgA family protein [Alphaproteobacteria bacterium]